MDSNEEKKEIRVLMVAFAAQGHINPLLRLGKRLVSKGLKVTLATTEITRHRIFNSFTGAQTTPTSIFGINLEFYSDGLSLDYDRKNNLEEYMDIISKSGPIGLKKLIQDLSHGSEIPKFSCIINNPFVPWVADVAADLEIPCAMLWIQPCTVYAIYYRFYNSLNIFPTLTDPDRNVELPGLPLMSKEDLPSFVLPSNPLGFFSKLLSELFANMEKLKWLLGNSFYELEKDVIDSMNELFPIKTVGPLVLPTVLDQDESLDIGIDMWKSDDSCLEWLDNKPPSSVIYVSFGSILVLSQKQTENVASALKNSGKPFLWVVKPPDRPGKNREGILPINFLEETKEQGLVVKWCQQTKVLAHPSIACFISHCGWSSTLETISTGVPMIAYPQWTDQPTNAKLVVDILQMGLRLRFDEDGVVSGEELERCIQEVTNGPRAVDMKMKAAALKHAARAAVVDGGSSDKNIQSFVDELIGKS